MTSKHVEKNGKRQLPLEPTVGREVAAALFNAGITGEKPPARSIAWADKKHPVKVAVGQAMPSGRRYAIDRDGKSYRWFCTTNGQSSLCGYESVIEAQAGAEAIELEQLDGRGRGPTKSTLEDQMSAQLGGFVSKGQAAQKAVDAQLLAAQPFTTSKGSELISLDLLFESPKNPRKVFNEVESLAKSIKATQGLLVPIVARPSGDRYEIIAGARRFRALELLKAQGEEFAEKALVDIRPLSDAQLAEAMMAENDQRESLLPLEQAEGYRNMLEAGFTKELIAERLGVSIGTVHGRLKLLELGKRALRLMEIGTLPAALATPLGRYPVELQDEALERMLNGDERDTGEGRLWEEREGVQFYAREDKQKRLKAGNCIAWLQENFTKSLKSTPFDQKDETILVPKACWPDQPVVGEGADRLDNLVVAPACGGCPKNSRNMVKEIAGEDPHNGGKAGFCTGLPCYQAKWDSTLAALRLKAKETGQIKVLTPAQSAKALQSSYREDVPYAKASEVVHEDPKKRTWSQLQAEVNEKLDDSEQLRKVIATTEEGKVEMVEKTELLKQLAASGVKWAQKKKAADKPHDYRAAQQRDEAKREVRTEIALDLLKRMATMVREKGPTLPLLRSLAEASAGYDRDPELELELFGMKNQRELDSFVEKKATVQDLIALIYVRNVRGDVQQAYNGFCDETQRSAKELKIDLKKREKEALAAAKAGAKEADAGEPGDDE